MARADLREFSRESSSRSSFDEIYSAEDPIGIEIKLELAELSLREEAES